MKAQHYIALLLSLILGVSTLYLYNNPDKLRSSYLSLSEKCTLENDFCVALLSPLRSLSDTAFEIKRKKISLKDLPVLRIYMPDGALKKLQDKRSSTLVGNRPILLSEKDDWVRATILSNRGKGVRKNKVQLRLKGDWADHLRDSQKLSFRIKVRNKEKIFGMSKFSIQAPKARNYHHEPILLDMMRTMGVLAPRYYFVDVRINDMKIGIMALEEHFTKQLVESQHRREGPIVAIDEDMIWRQRHLNDLNDTSGLHYSVRDYPIKVFKQGKFKPGTARTQQNIRAMSLLHDYLQKELPANKVFDADKLSSWWIIVNVWQGLHGAITHNLRFYFNPVTALLEPISFDNDSHPRKQEKIINNMATGALSSDINFRYATLNNLKKITDILASEKFSQEYIRQQKLYLDILAIDGLKLHQVSVSEIRLKLAETIKKVAKRFSAPVTEPGKQAKNNSRSIDPVKFTYTLKNNKPLHTHLRSSIFWYPDHAEIELKNLTMREISISSVYFEDTPDTNLWINKDTLPVYTAGNNHHIHTQNIKTSGYNFNQKMFVRYSYLGEIYNKQVNLQFRDFDSGYMDQDTAKRWYKAQGVIRKKHGKTLLFPAGRYTLNSNLEVLPGWKMVLLAGTKIELKNGAILKLNGALYALGTDSSPVEITIQSSASKGLLGSWGGILISKSEKRSYLKHLTVTGTTFAGLPQRQDSSGLTGCISFYNSDVSINDSLFLNLQCEDALNVISSNFSFNNLTIDGSQADAFDSDFSTGTIENSTFIRIGNDGVDVSGSNVSISNSHFSEIADKAISVGEKSNLTANTIVIDDAKSGVVSKDDSVANINDAQFKNIHGSALFAYVKKQEYGPASLHCNRCTYKNVEAEVAEQFGSSITIDGKPVQTTPFTRKQLRAADYIK